MAVNSCGKALQTKSPACQGCGVCGLSLASSRVAWLGGRARLLTLLFILALLGRGFWRLPRKSGGPPLFAPSLKIKGNDTHNNSGFSVI
jgi:hypothetical protein